MEDMTTAIVAATVAGLFGIVNVALGVWLKMLSDALKDKVGKDEHDGTIQRIERELNFRVHVDHCGMKERLAQEKFRTIEKMVEMSNKINAEDHNELKGSLSDVLKDQKVTSEVLASINQCMALLTERISKLVDEVNGK